ncbi:MAG: hypothetical protein AAGD34_12555 [Pseudomonadota bacterium]
MAVMMTRLTRGLRASRALRRVTLALALGFGSLAGGAALAADGETVGPLFADLYADPGNVDLNIAYAQRAESRGEYRKALTTYERVLLIDPSNAAARKGMSRMRFLLAPNFTNFRFTIGGGFESNPIQRPDFAPQPSSGFGALALTMRDERRIGRLRWRTNAFGGADIFTHTPEVTTIYAGGDVGPLIQLSPSITLRPSVVGTYRTLDGVSLFGEAGGALELEGYLDGARQSVRLGAVWREYGSDWVSDGGIVVDLTGHFARAGLLSPRDTLIVRPNARYSGVENANGVLIPENFEPGKYFQIGGRVDYRFAFTERLSAGVEMAIYQRWFEDEVTAGGDKRSDTYFAPGASVRIGDILTEAADVTLGYRYEVTQSNDPGREFDNHVVSARFGVNF